MRFTAMIIDDEQIVREGIEELIDWEEAGYRLGSSGRDGREGLANILRENPDLVLVDIKMPGLNGLEVIKEAKSQGFSGHFIILTGFSEFEYAKAAISMGVEGYLLKPIDEDELLEYVEKIRKKLEEKAILNQYHSQNEDKARQELLRRIVLNEGDLNERQRDISLYRLSLEGDMFCVALCRQEEGGREKEDKSFYDQVRRLAEGDNACIGMFRDYCTWNLFTESQIKLMLVQDVVQLQMRLSKKYASLALSDEVMEQLLKMLMAAEGLKELLGCYEQALMDLSRKIGAEGGGNIIRRVYYYMEKNYDKDIKLENIAKTFNYNSAYLGKLFRKEIGENFNNSLDRIRIDNAKRLLQETDLKVYQISERVGYGSIDYFYMKFKKYVGISPKEYRKNVNMEE